MPVENVTPRELQWVSLLMEGKNVYLKVMKCSRHFLPQLTTDWRLFSRAAFSFTVKPTGLTVKPGVNNCVICINLKNNYHTIKIRSVLVGQIQRNQLYWNLYLILKSSWKNGKQQEAGYKKVKI